MGLLKQLLGVITAALLALSTCGLVYGGNWKQLHVFKSFLIRILEDFYEIHYLF